MYIYTHNGKSVRRFAAEEPRQQKSAGTREGEVTYNVLCNYVTLNYNMLYYITLHYIILYCIVLYDIMLCYVVLWCYII